MRRISIYIYQRKDWPDFDWDSTVLMSKLGMVRHKQGKLSGKMEALGFSLREEAVLETFTIDVLKSAEIEGEVLQPEQVRSSIARKLGMDISGLVRSDCHVDGVVEMMMDATQNYNQPISQKRLFAWHAALFPTGRSGMHKIAVGKWRNDANGPMQVVSGALGKERVHYQAPDADIVHAEMNHFIKWFNSKQTIDPVLKAAIAHLWFVAIHPFEDGNGRMARTMTDMQLARADGNNQRFYSMSAQIRMERNKYYDILEQTQKGTLDITPWVTWFLDCLISALSATEKILHDVLVKADFWEKYTTTALNERQHKMLNKLLDGFDGKLTSVKWAKINKYSSDTALRDIQNLIKKSILLKDPAGGRSTNYLLNL